MPLPEGPRTARTPCPVERSPASCDLGVAPEEPVRVIDVVGHESEIRRSDGLACQLDVREQAWILLQDGQFQRGEVRPRVQPQLRGQDGAGPLDRRQGLALPAGLILRPREQPPALFAQRLVSHQRTDLSLNIAATSGPEGRLDTKFLRIVPQLLQSRGLPIGRLPSFEVDERLALPQLKGLGKYEAGPIPFPQAHELAALNHSPLEPTRIHLVVAHQQSIPPGGRFDRFGAETLAKPDDAALDDLGPRGWGHLPPQGFGKALGSDGLAGMHGKGRKYYAVAGA